MASDADLARLIRPLSNVEGVIRVLLSSASDRKPADSIVERRLVTLEEYVLDLPVSRPDLVGEWNGKVAELWQTYANGAALAGSSAPTKSSSKPAPV